METIPLVSNDRDDDDECADDELSGDEVAARTEAGTHGFETRIDDCIRRLRAIVGDDVSRDCLRDVLLAADFDLNRALNFFFAMDNLR